MSDLKVGQSLEIDGDVLTILEFLEEPNSGLARIEIRGWGLTVPTALIEEIEQLRTSNRTLRRHLTEEWSEADRLAMDGPLHEFIHKSGLRVRVPKCFYLHGKAPDTPLQLVRGHEQIAIPIEFVEDIAAYLKALAWYEGDAMTPASPDWLEFVELLKGKKGIHLHRPDPLTSTYRYSCSCSDRPDDWVWDRETNRWPKAWAILEKHFPSYDRQDTAAYWMLYKADCDHLVAFNIDGVLETGFSRMIRGMLKKEGD